MRDRWFKSNPRYQSRSPAERPGFLIGPRSLWSEGGPDELPGQQVFVVVAEHRFSDAPGLKGFDMHVQPSYSHTWSKRELWILIVLSIGMGLLVYRAALLPGSILFTSDDNIGAMALRARLLPAGFWRAWDDSVLAGNPAFLTLNWTNLLLWILPLNLFHKLIHALDLAVASIGFGLFLRLRGIRLAPALLGALAACWLGSTFFLTYAGHIGKFGVVMFAALALWLIESAVQRRSIARAALAGAACGGMFLEQADVAVFFAMVIGPYALFALARDWGRNVRSWLRILVPMAILALLIGGRALWMASSFFAFDTADKPAESKEQIWEYCTQWSWPPEETIEWIAPGYYGWRSGEPKGPYWGRLGRSADWESTRQGFPNFKLETLYIGALPMLFAVIGAAIGLRRGSEQRADVWFWTLAAVLTFVLGCGKFTPIYRLFFELPGVSSIRAPVKFMQVTQLALGLLCAYGLNCLAKPGLLTHRQMLAILRPTVMAATFLLGWGVMATVNNGPALQRFESMGWGAAAQTIVENRSGALLHAGGALLAGAVLVLLMHHRPAAHWVWAVVGLVCIDQLAVSRHFVQTVPAGGYITENSVTRLLKERLGPQRVFLANQGSFYNQWLSVLFPYHGIATYNVAQIRMPDDYAQFLGAIGSRLDHLWRHFSVGYVLGPGAIWPELQSNPAFKDRFQLEYAYNVFPQGAGVMVTAGTEQQRGQHIVARHVAPSPRYALVAGWEPADEATTLARIADSGHRPFDRILVPPSVAETRSVSSGLAGTVDVLAYEPGFVRLRVAGEQRAVLRAGEKFTPYWRATLNGKPAELFRADHIFTGLFVEPGIHTIELVHSPPPATFVLQLAGFMLVVVALGFCMRAKSAAA